MNAPVPTKRCPGFAPGGIEPHEQPATREFFASNAGNKDGLATRCKVCGNLYGSAWAAAKRKGEKFSARRPKGEQPAVVSPLREEPKDRSALKRELAATAAAIIAQPIGALPPGTGATPEPVAPAEPVYADRLALRAEQGKAPGYTFEVIGGTVYALPESPEAVGSTQGQVALAACNEARATERKRRDALRKREERARKKAEAEAATA